MNNSYLKAHLHEIKDCISRGSTATALSEVKDLIEKTEKDHDQWFCNIRNKRCPLLIKTKYCLAKSCQYRVERSEARA